MAIIAIFYGDPAHPTHPEWLGLVVAACVLAYIMRRKQVMKWYYYVGFAGPIAWVGLVLANVHPALALVPIIPFLPAERPVKKECAEKAAEAMIDRQESVVEPGHEHEHGHGHDAEAPLFKFEEQCQVRTAPTTLCCGVQVCSVCLCRALLMCLCVADLNMCAFCRT